MSRGRRVPVLGRVLGFRAIQWLVLVALGALAAAPAVLLLDLHASAVRAAGESVRSELGQRSWAIQDLGGSIGPAPGRWPIATIRATVSTESAALPVNGSVVDSANLPVGTLVAGRRPTKSSELALSRHAAEVLNVELGAQVKLGAGSDSRRLTVVGLLTDVLDRDAETALIFDPHLLNEPPTVWVTDEDPLEDRRLTDRFDTGQLSLRSTDRVAADRQEGLPSSVRALPVVAVVLTVLLGLLALGGAAALTPTMRTDAAALVAAGWSRRRAWRLFAFVVASALLVGGVAGSLLIAAVVIVLRSRLAGMFGMDWQNVTWLTLPQLGVVAVLPLVAVMGSLAVAAGSDRFRRRSPALRKAAGQGRHALLAGLLLFLPSVAGLLVFAVLRGSGKLGYVHPFLVLPMLAMAGVGTIVLGSLIARRGMSPALASTVRTIGRPLTWVAGLLLIVGVLTSYVSALTAYNAQVLADRAATLDQPATSLVVSKVPDPVVESLNDRYREFGGHEVIHLAFANEAKRQARVTSPEGARCLLAHGSDEQAQVDCLPPEPMAPLNVVALSSDRAVAGHADPLLISDGRVGIAFFRTGTSEVIADGSAAATADGRFGGVLPGLVLDPRSPAARDLGLTRSGENLMWFRDFDRLSDRNQAAFRSELGRYAPSSITVTPGDGTGQAGELRLAGRIAWAGAALVAAVGVASLAAIGIGYASVRELLLDLGLGRRRLRTLSLRLLLPLLGGAALLIGLVPVGVWVSALQGQGSYSPVWMLPMLALVFVFVFGWLMVDRPRPIQMLRDRT